MGGEECVGVCFFGGVLEAELVPALGHFLFDVVRHFEDWWEVANGVAATFFAWDFARCVEADFMSCTEARRGMVEDIEWAVDDFDVAARVAVGCEMEENLLVVVNINVFVDNDE